MVGSQILGSHHFVCHLYATQPNLKSVDVAQMHQFDDSILASRLDALYVLISCMIDRRGFLPDCSDEVDVLIPLRTAVNSKSRLI